MLLFLIRRTDFFPSVNICEHLRFYRFQAFFIDLCLGLDDLEYLQQSLSLRFAAISQLISFDETEHVGT